MAGMEPVVHEPTASRGQLPVGHSLFSYPGEVGLLWVTATSTQPLAWLAAAGTLWSCSHWPRLPGRSRRFLAMVQRRNPIRVLEVKNIN